VRQVTSAESGDPISACSSLSLSIEGVCSELVQTLWSRLSRGWVARVSNGHLLALVPGIALLKLFIWLLTPERDKDESERDYWRIHRG
jgi:hypothetical protein